MRALLLLSLLIHTGCFMLTEKRVHGTDHGRSRFSPKDGAIISEIETSTRSFSHYSLTLWNVDLNYQVDYQLPDHGRFVLMLEPGRYRLQQMAALNTCVGPIEWPPFEVLADRSTILPRLNLKLDKRSQLELKIDTHDHPKAQALGPGWTWIAPFEGVARSWTGTSKRPVPD